MFADRQVTLISRSRLKTFFNSKRFKTQTTTANLNSNHKLLVLPKVWVLSKHNPPIKIISNIKILLLRFSEHMLMKKLSERFSQSLIMITNWSLPFWRANPKNLIGLANIVAKTFGTQLGSKRLWFVWRWTILSLR